MRIEIYKTKAYRAFGEKIYVLKQKIQKLIEKQNQIFFLKNKKDFDRQLLYVKIQNIKNKEVKQYYLKKAKLYLKLRSRHVAGDDITLILNRFTEKFNNMVYLFRAAISVSQSATDEVYGPGPIIHYTTKNPKKVFDFLMNDKYYTTKNFVINNGKFVDYLLKKDVEPYFKHKLKDKKKYVALNEHLELNLKFFCNKILIKFIQYIS